MVRKRIATERREPIDIDAVIASKYPNRYAGDVDLDDGYGDDGDGEYGDGDDLGLDAADALAAIRAAEPPGGLIDDAEFDAIDAGTWQPPSADDGHDGRPAGAHEYAAVEQAVDEIVADEPRFIAPPAVTGFPPPTRRVSAAVPLPGEPDDFFTPSEPTATGAADTRDGVDAFSGDPYQQLARRRARVAAQAAEAFREVHKLRTEALRRASQAEHNASLAAHARTRAGRMVRDTRRVEAQGRRRPSQVPSHEDAYGDVHRFRTEALKRAQQAEHGAQSVAQARQRAGRLLAEQREIEAEMAKLQRLRTAAATMQRPT
jgi:hypothetical protein